MILLIEVLVVLGLTAVGVNWWLAQRRAEREAEGAAPEPPPLGAPGRTRWLLKQGRLAEAAREASRSLLEPPAPAEVDAPTAPQSRAQAQLTDELERALSEVRAQRAATPDAEQLPPLTADERAVIAHGDRLAAIRSYMQRTGVGLDEAMSAVARSAATVHDAPEYRLTPTEERLLVEGNVITVIKLLRERTGLSLLKAKDLVERKLRELE